MYVDYTTTVERVSRLRTSKHYTTATARETVPADKMSSLMARIVALAEAIGVRVNCKKTQLALINCDNGCILDSSINVNDTTIASSTNLKLLGFNLGTDANIGGPRLRPSRKIQRQVLVADTSATGRHPRCPTILDLLRLHQTCPGDQRCHLPPPADQVAMPRD